MIDLIIVSYNGKEYTGQAIESALSNTIPPQKILVVDNNSSDGSVEYLSSKFKGIQIVANKTNLSYGGGANLGIKYTDTDYVVISNNDVVFPPNFFAKLREAIKILDGNFGILGFSQIYPNGKSQFSFGILHSVFAAILNLTFLEILYIASMKLLWKLIHFPRFLKVGYADGAIICVNKNAFTSIGGFDEDFFFYSEDVDLCYRMKRNGYKVLIDMENTVIHYRGQGKNDRIGVTPQRVEQFVNSRVLYCKKHLSSISARIYLFLQGIFYFELFLKDFTKVLFGKSNKDTIKFCLTASKLFFKNFFDYRKEIN